MNTGPMNSDPVKSAPPPARRGGRGRRAPGRGLRKLFTGGPATMLVTLIAIGAVAAVTVGIVQVAAPGAALPPGPPAPAGWAAVGAFSHHPVRIAVPARPGSYLGAYADGVPRSYQPVQAFTRQTGVRPNLALYYSGWEEPFQMSFAMRAASHGAIPVIQIEPTRTSLAAIAVGGYDRYLEAFATAVAYYGARTGHGVVIGFAHEPNGTWYPWGWRHTSPSTWVAAWRHLVRVFRQEGADDVAWLWTVNIIDRKGDIPSPLPWWPGSAYVSWIGIDGYYYKPSWTFASLFGPTIRAVRTRSLDPVLISETAAAPAAGQAAKVADLSAGIRAYGLLGYVWFDAKRHRDWRLAPPAAAQLGHGARALHLAAFPVRAAS
jgi:mannan endo-1,4-beta-mannosidase